MLGKFPRITTIFFEDLRARLVGRFEVSFEAYWINVGWPFRYCGKAELSSGGHKMILAVFEILVEAPE